MFQIHDFTPSTSLNPLKTKGNLFSLSVYYQDKHKRCVGPDNKPVWTT